VYNNTTRAGCICGLSVALEGYCGIFVQILYSQL
jgi:hypothetical protein